MKEFETIYSEYYDSIFQYVRLLCKDETWAEEITQETFFKALNRIDTFRGECKLSVWLCQIAKNIFYTQVKRQQKQTDYPFEQIPDTESIEQRLFNQETAFALHKLLHQLENPYKSERERKKAASFRAVKKRILKIQIFVGVSVFVIVAVLSMFLVGFMKTSEQVISYEDNISVLMTDDGLIGRLQGNQANYLKLKRVDVENGDVTNAYLFFYLSGTKWDSLVTSDAVFSEYTLCPTDKGATQIDCVFYYTGDYTGMETMNESELQTIIDTSILLWEP